MFHTSAVLLHEASLILKCARALTREARGNKALSFTVQGTSCDVELGGGGGWGGTIASAWLHKGTQGKFTFSATILCVSLRRFFALSLCFLYSRYP